MVTRINRCQVPILILIIVVVVLLLLLFLVVVVMGLAPGGDLLEGLPRRPQFGQARPTGLHLLL